MKPRPQTQNSHAQPNTVIALLAILAKNLINAAVNRQLMPTVISGFLYTILQTEPESWIWTIYGMFLGTAIGLMFDEEAKEDLIGPMDRIDHAAVAVALALSLHFTIYIS